MRWPMTIQEKQITINATGGALSKSEKLEAPS
jgi:hypothetical protein